MGKYSDDAKKLLDYVGGKQNITAVTHCMTRMRFVLADPEKADVAKIEALKSVKGTFTQAGQFQVIIGNDVSVFYNEFRTPYSCHHRRRSDSGIPEYHRRDSVYERRDRDAD